MTETNEDTTEPNSLEKVSEVSSGDELVLQTLFKSHPEEEAEKFLAKIRSGEVQFDSGRIEMEIAEKFNLGELSLWQLGPLHKKLEEFEAAAAEYTQSAASEESESAQETGEPLLTGDSLADAAAILQQRCCVVDVQMTTDGYRRSKKSNNSTVNSALVEAGLDPNIYRVSKTLMPKGHPAVKRFNAAQAVITSYRDSKTIPLARIPVNSVVEKAETAEEAAAAAMGVLSKQAGSRVIMLADVDEFEKSMQVYRDDLQDAAASLTEAMPGIIETERKKAEEKGSQDFNEADYSTQISADVSWSFSEIGLSVNFEEAAPQAAERMRSYVQRQMVDTAALTVQDYARGLQDLMETVARSLGNRVRVRPNPEHVSELDVKRYRDAELMAKVTSDEDPELSEGRMRLELRYIPEGQSKAIIKPTRSFPVDKFEEAWRPYESKDKRRLTDSTIERMVAKIDEFKMISDMLGPAGEPLSQAIQNAQNIIRSAGGTSDRFLSDIRGSQAFRSTAAKTLTTVSDQLKDVVGYIDNSADVRIEGRKIRMNRRDRQQD